MGAEGPAFGFESGGARHGFGLGLNLSERAFLGMKTNPHDTGLAQIRKGPHSAHFQIEWAETSATLSEVRADSIRLLRFDFAQESERQVHAIGAHPGGANIGLSQTIRQPG